jgi:hypothetical protein
MRSLILILFILATVQSPLHSAVQDSLARRPFDPQELDSAALDSVILLITETAGNLINGEWFIGSTGYQKQDSTAIDTVLFDHRRKRISVRTDRQFAYAPAREPTMDSIENAVRASLGEAYEKYSITLISNGKDVRELVPNYYRSNPRDRDKLRGTGKFRRRSPPLVRNLSRPEEKEFAMYNMNIALWHSHGWYYEPSLHRWEWQRARIFQTVEDIYPMAYTLPMLVPMLEHAGATVFLPRERDWQVNEVVVDNDGSTGRSLFIASVPDSLVNTGVGFARGDPPYVDENPFRLGSVTEMPVSKEATYSISWIPEFPAPGEYAVYVSYPASPDNVDDAHYRVYHAGGITEFKVNQQMSGGTWVYLGRFRFRDGVDPEAGRVLLTNASSSRRGKVSADAVRFGGGMGNISRNGLTGNRPRYQEAARYYLQYAGFPDTLVWKLNTPVNDYKDDYQSRGEWVNYLLGAPSGPLADRGIQGMGIPVDLSLAFHTDAGITDSDTVIGTLGIFNTTPGKGYFPDGRSRMASRDLTDIIQSKVVEDIRAVYDPEWVRRALWDRGYSEAFRPNVPAMLLELFSHQNFIDMRFGQEPEFRFHISRSVYKGMLMFLSSMYGIDYIVQPLPVSGFRTEFTPEGGIRLSWEAVADPLEPTAVPDSYRIYTRTGQDGFDNGREVEGTSWTLDSAERDLVYSFRVTALNRGGESFPSETLSACLAADPEGSVCIINAFDRTGGPAWFNDTDYAGFMPMLDQGVPWDVDLHTVGHQFDYLKSSPWLDDDSPGHGASYADLEPYVIPGNSFDFSGIHGEAIRNAGYSFISVSDESVMAGEVRLQDHEVVDFLAGEEKTSYLPKNDTTVRFQVLPDTMLTRLRAYLEEGGNLLITGAHIASDMHHHGQDSAVAAWLKYRWRTGNASRVGRFYFMDHRFAPAERNFTFNTTYHPEVYTVEGADALEPADSTAVTLIRYAENNMSAAIAHRSAYRIVAMGFPFEAIIDPGERDWVMERILTYLSRKEGDE